MFARGALFAFDVCITLVEAPVKVKMKSGRAASR
jgi:hypothetical protein